MAASGEKFKSLCFFFKESFFFFVAFVAKQLHCQLLKWRPKTKTQKNKDFFFFRKFLQKRRKQERAEKVSEPGKSYWTGRLSTVDLLVLTSLEQLLFKSKILFTFLTKQATVMRRSTVFTNPLS
jgi:hypothetical protein